jgi:SAM-dependent methyltransferase
MWNAINEQFGQHFIGQSVVDLGCGYGDLALASLEAGASNVTLVDKNWEMVQMAFQKCSKFSGKVIGRQLDINPRTVKWMAKEHDIGIMTSVLPYLDSPTKVMKAATGFGLFFLEVQYAGDGPGPEWLKDLHYMSNYIEDCGFWEWAKIGETVIEGRNTVRDIWVCGQEGRVY